MASLNVCLLRSSPSLKLLTLRKVDFPQNRPNFQYWENAKLLLLFSRFSSVPEQMTCSTLHLAEGLAYEGKELDLKGIGYFPVIIIWQCFFTSSAENCVPVRSPRAIRMCLCAESSLCRCQWPGLLLHCPFSSTFFMFAVTLARFKVCGGAGWKVPGEWPLSFSTYNK